MSKKYCIICEKELSGSGPLCPDCVDEGVEIWTACENCGREFKTAERDYDLVLDDCPYCGRSKDA